jgi:ATP-dependent Clp protease ATP-binding subunit ClpB
MNAGEDALGAALVDLCAEAACGRLDPVVGRDAEIFRAACILARRSKRNPLLLGEPGVGKSAIAEGLAQQLQAGTLHPALGGRRLLSLNLGILLAGTSCRGDFEERLRLLTARLAADSGRSLLFVDEIHLLLRAGRSEGGVDAANFLKPLLARGGVACLGATTPGEWEAVRAEDPALARRFVVVPVGEPGPAEALLMLRSLRPGLEVHHGVSISDAALEASLLPAEGRVGRLPDRAVDLLDEACSRLRLSSGGVGEGWLAREAEVARRRFDLRSLARLREAGSCPATGVPVLGAAELLAVA